MHMTLTHSEILDLATQAAKEQETHSIYLRPTTTFRRGSREHVHRISDYERPVGKQHVCFANSHEEMMDKLAEIRAQRLVMAVAKVLVPAIAGTDEERMQWATAIEALGKVRAR